MLRRRSLTGALLALALALWASPAAADGVAIGTGCTSDTYADAESFNGNNEWCNGGTIQYPPYQFGAAPSSTCNSTNAGMAQWTGTSFAPNNTFEFCNGTSWIAVSGAAALSSITAATATNSIDSNNWAQTWKWGTLSTQTALTLTSSSETSGTILNVSSSNAAATGYAGYFSQSGTGASYALYATDASTGAGYGIYSSITGASNTGAAIQAVNNSASGWGVYSSGTSPNYFAGNVGIGTTSPTKALYLYTTTTGGLAIALNDAASGGAPLWTIIAADNGNSAAAGSLNFVVNANGASSQAALSLTTSDWVGISNNGYASIPTTLLDVLGNADTRIDVGSSDTTGGNYTGYQISSNETGTLAGGMFIPNNNKTIVELWSSMDTLNLTSTGSVGIGTTGPNTLLDVNGDMTDRNVTSCAMLGTDSTGKLVCKTPAMVLISTQTASSSASLQFTGLPTSYNTLFLNCSGLLMSVNTVVPKLQIGEGAGPTWETGAHYTNESFFVYGNGSSGTCGSSTVDNLISSCNGDLQFSNTSPFSLKLYFDNVGSSGLYKYITGMGDINMTNAGVGYMNFTYSGYWNNDTNPVTGIQIAATGGTIASGTCSLYGMN